jgi:outer membrane protein OmpA-like peptidoglycan-associated protein
MPRARPNPLLAVVLAALCCTAVAPAQAQSFGDRLRRRAEEAAKRAAEARVERRTTQAANAAMDGTEQTVSCAATGKACRDTSASGTAQPASAERSATAPAAGAGIAGTGRAAPPVVNSGRDFTPGARVILATDFSRDELGDFPRRFELKRGNMEVADVGGTRYLRVTSHGAFEIPLPETLPEMFTLEFDLKPVAGWAQAVYFTDERDRRAHLSFGAEDGGIEGPGGYRVRSGVDNPDRPNHVFRVQVMADGRYVKVYMDGKRVANAPNADIGRAAKLGFGTMADDKHPVLIGNLRIAAGGKDLYRALEASGRVTADGILFDTNSDRIRPESEAALREIGDLLAAHAGMRLAIEGHTDDVGSAAANQALSAKRAAAVKAYLVSRHGVDGSRLESRGHGATKPVARNVDEASRQQNRRVELVKL